MTLGLSLEKYQNLEKWLKDREGRAEVKVAYDKLKAAQASSRLANVKGQVSCVVVMYHSPWASNIQNNDDSYEIVRGMSSQVVHYYPLQGSIGWRGGSDGRVACSC